MSMEGTGLFLKCTGGARPVITQGKEDPVEWLARYILVGDIYNKEQIWTRYEWHLWDSSGRKHGDLG